MTDKELLGGVQETPAAVAAQVVEALKSGGGVASLRPLLQDVSLSPEQRNVLEFLELLEGFYSGPATDTELDELTSQQHPDVAELEALRDEVADLREVNDAAAAALGACRVCWGGEEFCPVCAGQGRPGANLPDARLYNELVRPAVDRMSTGRGTTPKSVPITDEEAQQ